MHDPLRVTAHLNEAAVEARLAHYVQGISVDIWELLHFLRVTRSVLNIARFE